MKVFISYADADKGLARRVIGELEESGLEVGNDLRDILPGDNWAAQTNKALQESEAMVVLLTPAAVRSDHVRKEIEYALGEKNYSNRLIPVIVGSTDDKFTEKIPWILRRFNTVSLSKKRQNEDLNQITKALNEATAA